MGRQELYSLAINELEKRNLEIHELNQKNNSILGMKIRNKINQLNQMKNDR